MANTKMSRKEKIVPQRIMRKAGQQIERIYAEVIRICKLINIKSSDENFS